MNLCLNELLAILFCRSPWQPQPFKRLQGPQLSPTPLTCCQLSGISKTNHFPGRKKNKKKTRHHSRKHFCPTFFTDKKRIEIHYRRFGEKKSWEIIHKSQSFTDANQFHIHLSQIGVPQFIIAPLYHLLGVWNSVWNAFAYFLITVSNYFFNVFQMGPINSAILLCCHSLTHAFTSKVFVFLLPVLLVSTSGLFSTLSHQPLQLLWLSMWMIWQRRCDSWPESTTVFGCASKLCIVCYILYMLSKSHALCFPLRKKSLGFFASWWQH